MNLLRRVVAALFVILLVGGSLSSAQMSDISLLRHYGEMLFLWVAAATLLLYPHRATWQLMLAACIGFVSEIVGVHTGMIYGTYHYTSTLGLSILGVPLAMLAAWFVLLSYSWFVATSVVHSLMRARIVAALLMVAFDLVIDPVAIGPMHLWVWDDSGPYHGIPLYNFAGWFSVSLVTFLFVRERITVSAPHVVGWAIVAFFSTVAFRNGISDAGFLGVGILALDAAVMRSRWMLYIEAVRTRVQQFVRRH
jgi:uncharacterized membrane protein